MRVNLGLVEDFNEFKSFPTDTKVLDMNNMTVDEYKEKVKQYLN